MTRAGFGERHPDLTTLLATVDPIATGEACWLDGTVPLWVSAYATPDELPSDLVTSVRCVVRVGDRVVYCENKDGTHPLPGGRRQPGETYARTAIREVHEETGWLVQPNSLRRLGWLHLEHRAPRRPDDPYPYPDLLQLIYQGAATERDGQPGVEWTDTDGYELRSSLVTVAEARARTSKDLLAPAFLDLLD
jgi:ADP-ribose pyrophosphatase YjhB (NUDIX family)